MNLTALHLLAIAMGLTVLGVMHFWFPRLFRFKEDLAAASLVNRELMKVHTWFIGIGVLAFAAMTVAIALDYGRASLASAVALAAMGAFWGVRFLVQFWGFDARLRTESRRNHIAHWAFAFVWADLTFAYLYAAVDHFQRM